MANAKTAIKRLKNALDKKYEVSQPAPIAGAVGDGKLFIDGQLYNGAVAGVTQVVNVGRPAAAQYAAKTGGGIVVQSGGGGGISTGGGATSFDQLTGVIANEQAPQFLLRDGTRSLTGSMAVADGATIDGVDISVHAANPNAHHNQQHGIVSSDHTVTGSALDIVGLTATNALGILTPSASPGAASAILKSDSSGRLTLPLFVASTKLTTPLIDTASGNLTLQPASNLLLSPATSAVSLTSAVHIGSSNFASQTTGWRVDYAGGGDFRYLFVDEMHAKAFIADLEQALAGGQIIAKSVTLLYANFTAPAAGASTTVTVRDLPSATGMAVFQNSDIIRIRTFNRAGGSLTIADCWGAVVLDTTYGTSGFDSTTKTQRYTFTRSAAPNAGAMSSGTIVQADAIVLDYGTSGNGFYEVNAIDGAYAANSPYAQIVTWSGHPATGQALKLRIGNLAGVTDTTVNPSGYGLYSDNAFLKGTVSAANNEVLLNSNGIRIRPSTLSTVEDINAYRFETSGGVVMGGLYSQNYGSNYNIFVETQGDNTNDAWLHMRAIGTASNGDANVVLRASNSDAPSKEAAIWLDVDGASSRIRLIDADSVRFEVPTESFEDHSPYLDLGANLGSVSKRWGVLYANQIVAGTISGTSMAGATWQYAGSMVIDANSGSDTTVSVVNNGAGAVVFDVLGTIRQSGTNVSLAGHLHDDRYFTETESDARYIQTATLGNYVLKAGDTMTGTLNVPTIGTASGNLVLSPAADVYVSKNVGIGVTTAEALLHIETANTATTNFLQLEGNRNAADTEVGILFKDRTAVTGGQQVARIFADRQGSTGNFDLVFHGGSQTNAGLSTEIMRLKGVDGKVGILQNTPAYTLDVTGDGRFTSSLAVGAALTVAGTISGASGTLTGTLGVTGALTGSTAAFTGAVTAPTINTASGNLTVAPAGGTTAITGAVTLTGAISTASWTILANGVASLVAAVVSSSVQTPSVSSSGNLTLSPTGGTVSVLGALNGNSTASFTTSVIAPLHTAASGNLTVSAPANLLLNAATGSTVDLLINNVSQWSASDSRLNPRGSMAIDIGDYNRKVRTLHAAELAVETLVAQNVMATIGGRVLVAPTVKLIADLANTGTSTTLNTGLTTYYSLNETSGNRSDSRGSQTLTDTNTVGNTASGKQGNAATFVGSSSEKLNRADNSTLSVGDVDFLWCAWIYPTLNNGARLALINKGSSSTSEYLLEINWATSTVNWSVWNSSGVSTEVVSTATVVINTWYFVCGWHDATNNVIGVSVNGVETTAAHSTGVRDGTGNFCLGARDTDRYYTGHMDEVAFWDNYLPSAHERRWLYNKGAGRTYADINTQVQSNIDVDSNTFANGDFIYLAAAPGGIAQIEAMRISSAASAITGGYRYTAVRNHDGTGLNSWYIGDAVVDTGGSVGAGYIDLTSTSTIHGHSGPTIAIYQRSGIGVWNETTPTTALGNLRSFVDYVSDAAGLAIGNDLTLTPTGGFVGLTADATNGLRLFNVDVRIYDAATKALELTGSEGLNMLISSGGLSKRRQQINWFRDLDSKSATPAVAIATEISGTQNACAFTVNRNATNAGAYLKAGVPTAYIEMTETNDTTSNGQLYAGSWTIVGNVGIGIAPSTMALDINGHARIANASSLYLGGRTDAGESGWRFTYSTGAYFDVTDGDIVFRADGSAGATERMRINYSTGAVTFANNIGTDWTALS